MLRLLKLAGGKFKQKVFNVCPIKWAVSVSMVSGLSERKTQKSSNFFHPLTKTNLEKVSWCSFPYH